MLKSISISSLVLLASLGIATAQQKANDPASRRRPIRRATGLQVAAGRQGGARLACSSRDKH